MALRTKFFSILWCFHKNWQNIVLVPPPSRHGRSPPIGNPKSTPSNTWGVGVGGRVDNDVEHTAEDLLHPMYIASHNFPPPKYRDIISHCGIQAVNSCVHWYATISSQCHTNFTGRYFYRPPTKLRKGNVFTVTLVFSGPPGHEAHHPTNCPVFQDTSRFCNYLFNWFDYLFYNYFCTFIPLSFPSQLYSVTVAYIFCAILQWCFIWESLPSCLLTIVDLYCDCFSVEKYSMKLHF